MSLEINTESFSLLTDRDGVVRVGGTRVTLDTIIEAFQEGATAEEIAQQYDSLQLGDIYAVIGYYLKNRSEIEVYLRKRQNKAKKIRKWNEDQFDPHGIRKRLLARRSKIRK